MTAENQFDSWSACKAGTLNGLAIQLQRQRVRQRLVMGTVGSGLLGATLAVVLLLNSNGEWKPKQSPGISGSRIETQISQPRGMHVSCGNVLNVCDQYLLGSIGDEMQQRVRVHLGHCPGCEAAYRKRASELQVEFTVLTRPLSESSFTLYAAR